MKEEFNMILNEADTRAKLIDPALHRCGWTENLVRREETERSIDIVDGKPRRRQKGRIDYLLRIKVNINSQPIAVARQFEEEGTEELENPYIFSTPCVVEAGGLEALKVLGNPEDIINETKERLFAE